MTGSAAFGATAEALSPERPARLTGALAIAAGAASLLLLANHPGGAAHDFSGMVREEAANRVVDGVVHGGFILVLSLQAICYVVFASRRTATPSAIAGIVFFAFGSAFLAGSMLVDGLILPAVASRYAGLATGKIADARGLFVLMGSAIQFLMPMGLGFQAAAIASWGLTLFARNERLAGIFAVGLGVVMLAALIVGAGLMNPFVLMGAILGTSLWAFVVGGLLVAGRA